MAGCCLFLICLSLSLTVGVCVIWRNNATEWDTSVLTTMSQFLCECANGGICTTGGTNSSSSRYTCQCATGYTGQRCEHFQETDPRAAAYEVPRVEASIPYILKRNGYAMRNVTLNCTGRASRLLWRYNGTEITEAQNPQFVPRYYNATPYVSSSLALSVPGVYTCVSETQDAVYLVSQTIVVKELAISVSPNADGTSVTLRCLDWDTSLLPDLLVTWTNVSRSPHDTHDTSHDTHDVSKAPSDTDDADSNATWSRTDSDTGNSSFQPPANVPDIEDSETENQDCVKNGLSPRNSYVDLQGRLHVFDIYKPEAQSFMCSVMLPVGLLRRTFSVNFT
ncbi:hypothetical protein BaRGS_00035875, partial [Batillaria attramentaria]